jgi:magnesium-transporting ATPase (P-type)
MSRSHDTSCRTGSELVFARSTPLQEPQIVKGLQKKGAMT